MAAITLKDLMDPLSKIAAAAEQTNEKLDALIAVSTGGNTGGGLELAIITQLEAQTEYLKIIADNSRGGGLSGFFGGRGNDSKEAASAGEVLQQLGLGASSTAKGMLLWMLVPKKAVTKFVDFVQTAFAALADQDTKKTQEGVDVLATMGGAIKSFAGALALSALLLIPGIIAIPFLVLAIGLVGGAMALLGMVEGRITKGVNALDGIGDAIFNFAVGLASFALVTMFILMKPMILLGMVGSLLLVGGAVALLGLVEKQIDKGSGALAIMGLALGVFSLGYALFAFMTKDITLEQIGMQAAILVGVGLATALLGLAFSFIIQGAFSLAAMGIGLAIFGLGYTPFAEATKDTTMEDVGVQLALLLGLGLEFAAAGFGALFIIPGAAAFAAVGGALLVLAPGLKEIKKVDFTEEDSLKLATMLSGVKTAFLGPGSKNEGGVGGFFKKIGGAITGAVDAVRMLEAAAGFAAAGMALTKLSIGLKAYQRLDWSNEETIRLTGVLSGISTAFAQAGGEAATPTGFFGKVFGNAFSPNATKKGIDSVMGAGKALKSIAIGLTEFQKLVEKDVDFDYIGKQIELTVGFIQRAFAAVAEEGNVDAGGFFGTLFGIKKNKVAEGLDAVQGAGKALTDIAVGLTEFQKLVEAEVDFDAVGAAISKSVGFVQEAFSAVAEQGNVQAGGFFGSLFKIKKNKVQEGIDSVKGAGAELKTIADALSTFAGIEDPAAVAGKIKTVVGMVGEAFAAIGGMEEEDSAFFGLIKWDENIIKKGIKAVKGAGAELESIAKGLKTFETMTDPVKVATSIGTLFTSISDTFTQFYSKNPFFSSQMDNFSTFITTISDAGEEGKLMDAADGMEAIAEAVNSISIPKAEAFADLFKGAGELQSNRRAYLALADAVGQIRDLLGGPVTTGGGEGGEGGEGGGTTATAAGNGSLNIAIRNLNKTMGSVQSTLNRLPGAIQSIKIVVED